MSSPKLILILIALTASFGTTACRRDSAPNGETAVAPGNGVERQHPEGGEATVLETRFFRGSIGDTLDLQMKLMREGEKLTGSYFYQKVGTRIDLRGTVDASGNVTLEEFDKSGKQTGLFKGLWKQDGEGLIGITGAWNKPNSARKIAFSLQQEPVEFSNGVEIIAKQIKENNKKLKYEVDAAYPQLTGSVDPNFEKFNQTVRGMISRKVSDFKKEMAPEPGDEAASESPVEESLGSDISIGYAVALAKDDLISLEFTVSSYSAGAAHPNSYTEVVNFDLKQGKLIKLADVFQPGAKYLQPLSSYAIQALQKQAKEQGADAMLDDDWIKKGAGADLTNYDSWTITKKGLGITFDPYQVAAYAAGPQKVMVPYAALKDIIRMDGPAGQFVK